MAVETKTWSGGGGASTLLKAALPSVAKNTPLTFEALDLTLSIDAYRRLREDQRLSAKRAREVVSHAAQALLAG